MCIRDSFDRAQLEPPEAGMSAFVKQHYLQRTDIPREILLSVRCV